MPGGKRVAVRRMSLIATAIVLVVAASACVHITPTPEPAIVSFESPRELDEYYQPLIEEFQKKNKHITIELVRPRQYRWSEADVFSMSPFARHFMERDGLEVLDLTPFVEQGEFSRQDVNPRMLSMFDDEGELWAVPYLASVGVMYYNRDLFDQYGVAYPEADWTWDDFVRAAQAMYDPDDGVFGYILDEDFDDILAFVYQNGGRIFDDFSNPTRTTFDDPLTVEAVDWYAKLVYEFDAAPTPAQARKAFGISGYVRTGINEGRLGMWTDMLPGSAEDTGEEWDFRWGIAPMPKGQQAAAFAFVEGLSIAADAQSPDASWLWVDYLTRQIPPYGMPVRSPLVESKGFEDEVGKDVAAVARSSIEHALFFSPSGWDIYGSLYFFNEAIHKVIGLGMSAQEAMEWAQQQVEAQ